MAKNTTSPPKKVEKTTYKIWTSIEKHIIYSDGSDDYEDLKNEDTRSLGEFKEIKDARLQVDFLGNI